MKKIDKLMSAQEQRMIEVRNEWLKIGRGCNPLDRKKSTDAIRALYVAGGHKEPLFFYFDSPLLCVLGREVLRNIFSANLSDNLKANLWANLWANLDANLSANLWANLSDNLKANLWANLSANLWANLSDNLKANLRDNLRDNLSDNLGANLSDNLRANLSANLWANLWANLDANLSANLWANLSDNLKANLWANLSANLWANLSDNLKANLRDNLRDINVENFFAGQHWCAWEVFYDFCNEIGVPYSAQNRALLTLWLNQSRECHWWFPYKEICFVSERHVKCEVDDRGLIHGGVVYKDGFGVWAHHGVRVKRYVIEEPSKITLQEIESETNAEVRRVLIERFGYDRYIRESGAQKIHSDDFGTIWQKPIPNDEPLTLVEVINSTPEPDGSFKNYMLRVDPNCRPMLPDGSFRSPQPLTARNAVASTFGLTGEEYNPDIQT